MRSAAPPRDVAGLGALEVVVPVVGADADRRFALLHVAQAPVRWALGPAVDVQLHADGLLCA